MLFNSYHFIFGFMPATLLGFFVLGAWHKQWALLWLTAASLFFYAWWRPLNILLIAPSILVNYGICRFLLRHRQNRQSAEHESAPGHARHETAPPRAPRETTPRVTAGPGVTAGFGPATHDFTPQPASFLADRAGKNRPNQARAALIAGITFNVCFLGYFKYLTFGEQVLNDAFGTGFILTQVILPLGISFITFQKIALLIDVHAGNVDRFTLREYALFVLFFPQLIAGPIVHFREMMPQFRTLPCRFDAENLSVGLSLFFFGLAKKLLFADPLGTMIAPLYDHVAQGDPQPMIEAWIAALGFTLQIYFDFSGYCDMAFGLARFFGIKLPVNFNSPLKARSIIDFWARWHVTLTRFLTAYIYLPITLAMMRRRAASRTPAQRTRGVSAFITLLAMPTILTMLISGLWHGAGYTFILWGLLHGVLLCINHAWRMIRPTIWRDAASYHRRSAPIAFLLTFLSVVFAMALFRAPTVAAATTLWKGMIGAYGTELPQAVLSRLGHIGNGLRTLGVHPAWTSGSFLLTATARIAVMLVIALACPNTLQLFAAYEPALGIKPASARGLLLSLAAWQPSQAWAIGVACIALAGILSLGGFHEFLYWQF